MKFEDLGLAEALLRSVKNRGYHTTTKIQATAIPPVLEGRDVLGCAQTGTGKTAAFALPILHRLADKPCRVNGRGRKIRTLVLAPTRELAIQIHESFAAYGRHTSIRQAVVFGGVKQNRQVAALNRGVDVLIATPGRLLDLMQQGHVDLGHVETLVLDEADRMLDMGFLPDMKRIIKEVPGNRQTLLFSATLPKSIIRLAERWLNDPIEITVSPKAPTVEKISQSVCHVPQHKKQALLTRWLSETRWTRTLVFTRTKHGADKLVRKLLKAGIDADAFHGNKTQNVRQRVLDRFKSSSPPVLIATDIAARGLDVEDVSHVINYDLPSDVESYIHRIGRTGRAGAEGFAISFCDRDERAILREIEEVTNRELAIDPRSESFAEDAFADEIRAAEEYRRAHAPAGEIPTPVTGAPSKPKWRRNGKSAGSRNGAPKAGARPKSGARRKSGTTQKAGAGPKAGTRQKAGARQKAEGRRQK